MIGVTSVVPSIAVQFSYAKDLKTGTLVANEKAFTVNGKEVLFS